ncbi:MAG TPA: DUF3048 domain-containing protein [Acidimicrobiales bacterium]|nr:DUF3048 domain-containing protein [Acidimicrobiales bacterium]
MSQRRPSTQRLLGALLCVLALAAACSKDKEASPPPPAPTTLPPNTFPLTGRPIDDAAKAARAPLSVKIDNNSASRPQAGIDKADVIYEEFTEGITRFVVVFHSTDADPVGPVRSIRPADPVIIFPLSGIFAFSGGSPAIRSLVPAGTFTVVDENSTDVMRRRSGRSAPYNLYTTTQGLFAKAPGPKPPPRLAEFLLPGTPFGGAGVVPATRISLSAAPGVSAGYDWDAGSGAWKRSTDGRPHALEGGAQLAPNNVIVQFTPYSRFSGDAKVQYPEVIGSGEAWIFAAGQLVKGRWAKPGPGDVTAFTDSAGAPVRLPPGQTLVHLVAPGSAVTPA